MKDVAIAEHLASLGLEAEAGAVARSLIEAVGLTRAGKQRISISKLRDIESLVSDRFVRVCHRPACRKAGVRIERAEGRMRVDVASRHCDTCSGSDNRSAVEHMAVAMRRADKRNLLVVGGTPNTREGLKALLPADCEARFVPDERHTAKEAEANIRWADIVVTWASTQISHQVTNHYRRLSSTTSPPGLMSNRRGVAALALEVTRHLRGR